LATPLEKSAAEQPQGQPQAEARVVISKIFVTGIRIDARIGVYRHEMGREQPLIAEVELDVAVGGVETLAETFNYETILTVAREIAAAGHIALVETFAERLGRALLEDPRVSRARVRVDKPMALAPDATGAGVEMTLIRG
jgi:dihydroneopterin aldolase